ncbi:MAG: helix-turn-helix domain-containing protein [Pseudonocardiaceae bacterium]
MTSTEDTGTIGQRLRRIRKSRGKTQAAIAELAGIHKSYLSLLENGKRALDSLKLIIDLAEALQIAPSELTRIEVPAPGNGDVDAGIDAVRLAMRDVSHNRPGGQVLPVEVLRGRVTRLQEVRRRCRFPDVASDLPGLIRDLHTSIAAGRDLDELLPLASLLHVQVTNMWLKDAGAPIDLLWQADAMALEAAERHGEDTTLGLAAFGTVYGLLADGRFALAQAELDSVTLPTVTPETASLMCVLTMTNAVVAAMDKRPGDVAAPMDTAAELAERISEHDPFGFGFGPTSLAARRVALTLEAGEPDRALSIAEGVYPERLPFLTRQAGYWTDYGRAAARLRGRRDDAVRAFLKAEEIFPTRLYRDPFAREVIAELVNLTPRGRVGQDLRRLAWRADLRV